MLDSFYVTGNMEVTVTAEEDCCFYVGAAVDEGYGKPFSGHSTVNFLWEKSIRFTERAWEAGKYL